MHSRSLCQHVAQDLYPAMGCGTGQTSDSITAEQVSVIIPDTSPIASADRPEGECAQYACLFRFGQVTSPFYAAKL